MKQLSKKKRRKKKVRLGFQLYTFDLIETQILNRYSQRQVE